MPTLALIDGSGYIFRAYHALPPLTNPKGTPVGAVYGFVTMLAKLADTTHADHIAVVFDVSRVTFRNRLYPEYKANRPPPPDDLIPQFALVRDAADALNIPRIELADYEADDLIATYAREARAGGMDVVIVSSDKDLMQLIRDGVTLFDPMKQKPIGEAEVLEKFQVKPERVRDVLALMGDSSDNVPGVPGIGPKTAAELINTYGDLETMLAHAGEIKQEKRRQTIQDNAEKARLSYELIGLKDDVPLPLPITALALKKPEPEKLRAFLETHGFKTLVTRFRLEGVATPAPAATQNAAPAATPTAPAAAYELVQDMPSLSRWLAEARLQGLISFDTETTGLDATRAELVGFSLATKAGKACYVPVGHVGGQLAADGGHPPGDLFASPAPPAAPRPPQIPLADALAALKPILEDPAILKIGQNIKYDMLILKSYGIEITPVEDTMLLSYVLAAGAHGHGMDELAERHLGVKTITYDEVTGTGRGRLFFAEVDLEKARDYAAEDADITLRLWEVLKPQVSAQHMLTLYETIERPLIPVLVAMEARGIKVDVRVLSELSNDFALKMHALEQDIHKLAGRPFNIASPKQLGEVLFDEQGIEGGKKSSKTGAYSTDNQVLEELAEQGLELPAKVIEWRQLAKLRGTYTEALKEQINPKTGRVHTNFAMAVASTGRLSSSDPNLQNIPIRTSEGKKIRRAFVAEPGCKLISADYSQIELRLLAHIANISTLKEAFKNGQDIHAITASQMFGVPVAEVNADLRRSAKTINFGIIYGMSAHGLATRLGIGRTEAAAYIEQYFKQYPGIRDYMETTKEFARSHGYVETLYGRRCHLPGIADKNGARRQFSERAAINAPLQGTAADIIKRAMIAVESALPGTMLLQVHDELVFEVKEAAADAAVKQIKPAMEGASHISVPLTVEIGVGDNWGEIH